jgi:LysR family transcriptional regulator, hydrogen peroxide-inducible genes activator
MTLTELKYITAVARTKHFGQAAQACFVSQPTLSVAIRKLEEELSVTLFERNRTDVTITPIGELVIEQARRVLESAQELKNIVSAESDQRGSPLKVGVIYTIGPYLLPHLIPGLKRIAPEMPLLISEDYTDVLAEHLREARIDAAILSLPFEHPGIVTQNLYDEPFVVALPTGHRLAKKKSIGTEDLKTETMLLLKVRNCFRDQVLEACPFCISPEHNMPNSRYDISQTLESSSIETIRQMTALGAGVTVLPITSTGKNASLSDQLVVRPFAKGTPSRRVVLAYRRTFPRPQAIAALAESIRDNLPHGVSVKNF